MDSDEQDKDPDVENVGALGLKVIRFYCIRWATSYLCKLCNLCMNLSMIIKAIRKL